MPSQSCPAAEPSAAASAEAPTPPHTFEAKESVASSESSAESAEARTPPQASKFRGSFTSSMDHDPDSCKPCAFYFRPAGCSKGEGCDFCHISIRHCGNRRLSKPKRDRFKKLLERMEVESDCADSLAGDAIAGPALPAKVLSGEWHGQKLQLRALLDRVGRPSGAALQC